MTKAEEVVAALRSWPTVFMCECGGRLWHMGDGDDDSDVSKLTCESCTRYMSFGITTTVPASAKAVASGAGIYTTADGYQYQLPLCPN